MSQGLAPSKSTVYLSNLPFSLTNNDLHQIFGEHGKLVKVTIMKDKVTRKSRGVAFLLYLQREEAAACVAAVDGVEMFGRQLKAKLANDNGRAAEFIRRKDYPDKCRCFECGEEGHLSYACPKNALGQREPPPKKQRVRKRANDNHDGGDDIDTDEYYSDEESLSSAIAYEQSLRKDTADSEKNTTSLSDRGKRKQLRQDTYFSDEDEEG